MNIFSYFIVLISLLVLLLLLGVENSLRMWAVRTVRSR